ncbi:hybrid sensor histidine kinase/response regulator transcription factor [Pedobacter ginsengisoli]|uniref:hybrid sensor histidine kinase/response regulator transcription factor n=1 Tax=Pedobacter ginsengisoli TaxID=363852 RepID=UPI00254E85DC|nr:two-component regulator propeller domain-containing protein [Pedobacter ginsengisoli]
MICLLAPLGIFAQQQQIQFSKIDLSSGLSHNQVNAIFKDDKGFIWIGTLSGLNRFDGYQFKIFKHDPRDVKSLSDDFIVNIFELPDHKLYLETRGAPNVYDPEAQTFIRDVSGYLKKLDISAKKIREILKDNQGNFWFNALEEGIFKYDASKKTTLHYKCGGTGLKSLSASPVSSIQKDSKGHIWVIHRDKTIEMLDMNSEHTVRRITSLRLQKTSEFQDFKLFVDNTFDLWIYTVNNQRGIEYYDPSTGKRRFIDKGPGALKSNLINGMIQDGNGLIWIGTDHGGVNLLSKKDFSMRYLVSNEDDVKSIGQNSITSLYKDASGIIWVGTFKKGISYYHEKILKFPLYQHQAGRTDGLVYDDVNRFTEDDLGNIWIGTNGGGLFYFNRKSGQFKKYIHQPGNINSLANDIIVSLFIDHEKKLWIGSYFGGLSSFDGRDFKHYKHNSNDPKSLADDRVWDIMEDNKHRLWIATLSGGLDLLDRKTGTFTHKRAGQPNSIGSDFISCIIQDKKGNIWIGTSLGVDRMDINGRFTHFANKPGNANSLVNNIVYDVMEDSRGFIWIATRDGLSRFNPVKNEFRNFDSKDGLTEKATLKIVEDNNRNLWLSTSNGLFNIIVSNEKNGGLSYSFRKYDEHDGLQGSAFNANAGYRTRSGELIFGGANGFNIFQPERIKNDDSKPELVLSDLQIANKSINIGERVDGRVILKKSITFSSTLELAYAQNGFTLEFAALNYFNPQKIKYRYKLVGFDQEWQELPGNNRRATYTNIDPGEYIFKVISTNSSGNWVDNEINLKVSVLPPFYRTWIAYAIYILIVGGTLLFIRDRGIRKIKKEFLLEQERQQGKRMHELDMLKIKFFTNVSHEFRTPLSLIITPLEKLIRQAKDQEKEQLQMIHRNGRRLLNLVNQLLDFRRMEVQELRLQRRPGDIIQFVKELSLAFNDVAERKNIRLDFESDRSHLITTFDHDKIERILFNLLSNAFKFTPNGGKVTVGLQAKPAGNGQTELALKVSDTGIGIDADKKEQIFERFFQSDLPDSIVNQGSGIGLSITREFVKLHGGEIRVESEQNKGSVFTVSFLFSEELSQTVVQSEQSEPEVIIENHLTEKLSEPEVSWRSKKPILMLIEDNDDFRFYLKDNLKEHYQIAEAANGKEGWQKILSGHPDLIVSDVTMPELNGIDLCRKIKADNRTAHIPVILLTALSTEDQQLTGLETGASDYVTKPFNFEILLSKIRNLLQQQALSKKTYQKQLELRPSETEVESVNEKFLRQLSLHLEKHLSDSSYTVDQLSTDMNMSRVGLYKKIIPLTGKSPIEYIRSYRLQKSRSLLLKSQMTIAEVAYQVGFSNPKHFSKYFKEEFGVLPSVFAFQNRGSAPQLPS